MTRTATKPGRAKRALEATPWSELAADSQPPLKKATKSKATSHGNEAASQNESRKVTLVKEMKRVRKGESRRLKRIAVRYSDKHCFNCRKKGHTLSQCPLNNKQTEGTGMCFKCGSLNHMSKFCKLKAQGQVVCELTKFSPPLFSHCLLRTQHEALCYKAGTESAGACNIKRLSYGAYPYATCFVCKKTGHISKDCPDNNHGLYPNGGCCLECGSIRHLRRHCPEKQKKQGISNYTLSTMSRDGNIEVEPSQDESAQQTQPQRKVLNKRKTRVVTMT